MSITNPFYRTSKWRRASKQALVRAGFMCQRCGAPLGKGKYNVHHRKALRSYPELALEPQNHQALCVRCHRQVEAQARDRIHGANTRGFPIGPDHPWNTGQQQ